MQYYLDFGTSSGCSQPQLLLYSAPGADPLAKRFAMLPFFQNGSPILEPPLPRRVEFPARISTSKAVAPCSLEFQQEDLKCSWFPSAQAGPVCSRRARKCGPPV